MSREYVRIHVIHGVNQPEYVIRILVAAPQEYMNIYSTRRALTHSVQRLLAVGACLCASCVGPSVLCAGRFVWPVWVRFPFLFPATYSACRSP